MVLEAITIPMVKFLIQPPIQDQKDEGSCVFNALTSAMEAVEIDQNIIPPLMFSRQFAYYNYRKKHGEINQDNGASIREAAKLLAKDGVCLESSWPYTPENFATEPPPKYWKEAQTHKILQYLSLKTVSEMLACMAAGYGFVGGISVYESFESNEVAKTGIIPLPKKGEKLLGGHALYFGGGYDQHKHMIKGQNSWGADWGLKGNFWIPFAYLANPGLASDFWTIRK
jgi:C1A family cysteine protease